VDGPKAERLTVIPGTVPDVHNLPVGCKFVTRCPYRFEPCPDIEPPLIEEAPGHWVRCHLYPKAARAVTPILEVQDLTVRFPVFGGVFLRRTGEVRAVDGVSFTLGQGETLGLVGESGCGKTTVGRAIINILKAMSYKVEVSGRILYHHASGVVDLASLDRHGMRPYRADIQMVFQDPYSSLNPRKTVGQIVEEPLTIHTKLSSAERRARVQSMFDKVGLSARHIDRYPHEFSGGQRQRVGIARALATNPKIRRGRRARQRARRLDSGAGHQPDAGPAEEFGLSYIFIAHDLSVVRHISDRIAVMYFGKIVEMGPAEDIYAHPQHEYSKTLLAARPTP
jgi:ABC-type oligopeptide transport system ATPase subunit